MPSTTLSPYDRKFYGENQDYSYTSARAILRLLWKYYEPKSVVDVGCGIGTWLKAASELGVDDYVGLEGEWLTPDQVVISWDHIQKRDLKNPFVVGKTFDLAMSLEVAEHLPDSSALSFVESLTKLAPVVLFSAAIPNQGGTRHLNEQWPGYWATFFQQKGYVALDAIRCRTWDDPEVKWWYAQNTILYVDQAFLGKHEKLQELSKQTIPYQGTKPMAMVHPGLSHAPVPLKQLLRQLPGAFMRKLQGGDRHKA